ncbi:hypothetical protein B7463_g11539, partial [Scytalidium lignicola]
MPSPRSAPSMPYNDQSDHLEMITKGKTYAKPLLFTKFTSEQGHTELTEFTKQLKADFDDHSNTSSFRGEKLNIFTTQHNFTISKTLTNFKDLPKGYTGWR